MSNSDATGSSDSAAVSTSDARTEPSSSACCSDSVAASDASSPVVEIEVDGSSSSGASRTRAPPKSSSLKSKGKRSVKAKTKLSKKKLSTRSSSKSTASAGSSKTKGSTKKPLKKPMKRRASSVKGEKSDSGSGAGAADQNFELFVCDICGKLIKGKWRYECVSHPRPVEVCEVCVKRERHLTEHSPTHKFRKHAVKLPPVPELKFSCDLCGKNIDGTRFECDRCADFDLCPECARHHSRALKREQTAITKARQGRAYSQQHRGHGRARSGEDPTPDELAREARVLAHEADHPITKYTKGRLSHARKRVQSKVRARWAALLDEVMMLYIRVEINGVELDAMVDTGAQMTVMSASLAQKCGISGDIDPEFSGMAAGVGVAAILGRVHDVPLHISGKVYEASIAIIDNPHVGFLLGLDVLRKYNGLVKVKDNVLALGAHRVPFLEEHELLFRDDRAREALPLGCPIQ